MAVILTFTSSVEEITSGIPKNVTISSDVPATVYYTLDGLIPTIDSTIYIDPIEIPTNMCSVILSAFGVDGNDVAGAILTQTFSADTTRASVARNVGNEGIVLDRANMGEDYVDKYDADGNPATFLDIDPEELDMILSKKGFNGIAEGTAIQVGLPVSTDLAAIMNNRFVQFSTTEKAEFFNPNAKLVLIDNRIDNEVEVTLRPWGSLSNPYLEDGGKRIRNSSDDAAYISGGFVRKFYDARKNILVSYYYDNNENKYIKNIQYLPPNTSITSGYIGIRGGQPLVFQWIPRGRQSSI